MSENIDAKAITREMNKVRQVRQYTSEPIPQDVVDELLQVARWTGSSRNTQPWHFIVVTDGDKLEQISRLRTPINWVAESPLGIAIVLDGENSEGEAYDEGRVSERLLIAARLFGYGGGVAWYGDNALQSKAKEILGIPDDKTARSIVMFGKTISAKDPRPNPARSGRKPLEEIVSYQSFGDAKAG